MTNFSATTPFALVRRLATAGQDKPSVYLLLSEASAIETVRADLAAEIQVQLGGNVRLVAASEVQPDKVQNAFTRDRSSTVTLVTFDEWVPKLIESLDRNVVLVTTSGIVLLLANPRLAERIVAAAPNLRNRLTDVLAIRPDEASGAARI